MSQTKKKRSKDGYKQELMETPSAIRSMFMDSGAHGLYNRHAKMVGVDGYNLRSSPELLEKRYRFYTTKEFKEYCDKYAAFLKANAHGINYYVNVDAIYHPELSYRALKYLENEHGLKPIPVLHYNTSMKWIAKHLEEGYQFIGLGGLGQDASKDDYANWADKAYDLICSTPDRKPAVRTHGFAMTSWYLIRRYPWWSVDSASWVKSSAYGVIYCPHMRNGEFTYDVKPYSIGVSAQSSFIEEGGKHIMGFTAKERRIIELWLEKCGVKMGSVNDKGEEEEYGVVSHWGARARVNLLYYEGLRLSVPDWPWPFVRRPRANLGLF